MIGKSLALAAMGLALIFLAPPASSAPTANLNGVQTDAPTAEPVHYRRRCWRHRGHYHCRPYVRRYYYPSYLFRWRAPALAPPSLVVRWVEDPAVIAAYPAAFLFLRGYPMIRFGT
jgi:hypothetical protein